MAGTGAPPSGDFDYLLDMGMEGAPGHSMGVATMGVEPTSGGGGTADLVLMGQEIMPGTTGVGGGHVGGPSLVSASRGGSVDVHPSAVDTAHGAVHGPGMPVPTAVVPGPNVATTRVLTSGPGLTTGSTLGHSPTMGPGTATGPGSGVRAPGAIGAPGTMRTGGAFAPPASFGTVETGVSVGPAGTVGTSIPMGTGATIGPGTTLGAAPVVSPGLGMASGSGLTPGAASVTAVATTSTADESGARSRSTREGGRGETLEGGVKKRGRTNLNAEDKQARERKRILRNRELARVSNERRKGRIKAMETELAETRETVQRLEESIRNLERENEDLRNLLENNNKP